MALPSQLLPLPLCPWPEDQKKLGAVVLKEQVTLPSCKYLSENQLDDSVGSDVEKLKAKSAAICVEHDDISKITSRVCSSSYYKNQMKYLADYVQKAEASSQGLVIGLKATQKEIANAFATGLPDYMMQTPADAAGDAKAAERAAGFNAQLMRMACHAHMGVTNFAVGEAFLILSGEARAAGVKIGKLAGSIPEQVANFQGMQGQALKGAMGLIGASGWRPRSLQRWRSLAIAFLQ